MWNLLGVTVLVAANGFFVAAEFALVTVRKTRIDQLALEGHAAAKQVKKAILDLDSYIAGTQVGITIASLALGWIGEPALVKLLAPMFIELALPITATVQHGIAVGIAFTFITFLHVILGELVPKSIALSHPESTSLLIARPLQLAIMVFKPLIWSLNGMGHMVLRMIGLNTSLEHGSVHSSAELLLLIRQSHEAGHLDSFERGMLQKTFRFSETTVSEVMTPRLQVEALDLEQSTEAILEAAAAASYTRLPVYRKSIDEIIGVLYVHDIFQYSRQKEPPWPLEKLVRPVIYVPKSFGLDTMVQKFRDDHTQIAVVIDEYGGTAGIVTLEDVIETIFGEIQDSNEDPTAEIEMRPDASVILRGDTRLDDVNEYFGWNLREGGSATITGFLMKQLGKIPSLGDKVQTAQGLFEVIEMKKQRVTKIKVIR